MAQRYDIVRINFQANARGANAAIESLRVESEKCNERVKALKKELKEGIKMGKSTAELDAIRANIKAAEKETKQWSKAYNELVKGMRTLDTAIKAFNDGSLGEMNAAFQKAAYNAAKLTRTKLDPQSKTYKEDYRQLTALMDASQQNYARLQGDSAKMIKTLKEGGKVAYQALSEEIAAQKELLQVLSQTDKGYQRTQRNIAVMESYLRAMGGDYEYVRKNISDTRKVSDETLRTMYADLERVNNEGKVTKDIIRENARAMKEIRTEQTRRVQNVLGGDLGQQSEQSIRTAINNAKELLSTYKTNSREAQTLSAQIVNAEEHLKQYGVEAARAASREAAAIRTQQEAERQLMATMTQRMGALRTLSADALAETRKFWQAQMDGAVRGSQAYRDAEAALKRITELETTRKGAQASSVIANMGTRSDEEIRKAIQAFEQLRDAQVHGSSQWELYNKRIQEGKQYLDEWAKTDSIVRMEGQMAKLPSLSDTALQETRKFWESMAAGAEKGTQELRDYEANLAKVIQEEQERRQLANEMSVQKLGSRNLGQYSEAELRQAIEAGKQLIQTYRTASPEAEQLAQRIVLAEEHLKQYGVEAARAAQKEADAVEKARIEREKTDQLMMDQLQRGTSLTESALKAQEQYWQRLIDDPKTAAASLAQYQANLERVRLLQQMMQQQAGGEALAFFRSDIGNASASQIQEQAKALKQYRDSLPQKANADLIKEIDGYLAKAGMAAQQAAGQAMSLKQALQVSATAGKGQFKGTVEQLTLAKKSLEQMQQSAIKGGFAWRRMQEAINNIELELRNVGHISSEIQGVLDKPKGRSFNELKQAVEQGRQALNNMRTDTEEGRKAFDDLAKKVKEADKEMKQLGNTSKGTASSFDKAWSRLKTYIGLYMGAAVAIQKLTGTISDLMELSDKMGEVRKTTGFTADEVGHLSENLKKLDVRTSLTSLMELSASAGQLGLKTLEDVQGFTEAANKLMIALPEMGREAATEMMRVAIATGEVDKIGKQLREGTIEGSSATAIAMEKIASTIDRLRATSASTAPEITDFVKRVGAVGAQSGIGIDQVAALGSTISSLGMRVEMSATALSRMIPAIKNNAFELAKAIGVTPDAIRNLFEAGRGMEAILMILQHMKDSGMDEDSIEKMMGMGGMADVMKDLNQQGARAGIVFAGLSQNVEELRRQLGVAGEAYEENTAIQNEYNKMNETTAAQWERLKNQIEEAFVGDKMQRIFGGLIKGLRWIVDFITGNVNPALNVLSTIVKTIVVSWSVFRIGLGEGLFVKAVKGVKSLGQSIAQTAMYTKDYIVLQWQLVRAHTAEEAAAVKAKMATAGLNKAMKANIIMAVVAAVGYLVIKWYEASKAMTVADKAFGDLEQEYNKQVNSVNNLFHKLAKLREQELAAARQARDGAKAKDEDTAAANRAADAHGKLSGKYKETAEQAEKAKEGVRGVNEEGSKSAEIIRIINSKYGQYLGYMMSETSSAYQLAKARELINAKLRETITLRQQEAALGSVEQEFGGKVNKKAASMDQVIQTFFGDDYEAAARVSVAISEAAQKYAKDSKEYQKAVQRILASNKIQADVSAQYMGVFEEYRKSVEVYQNQTDIVNRRFEATANQNRKKTREAITNDLHAILLDWRDLVSQYQKAEGKEKERLAAEVYKQQRAYANAVANNADYFEGSDSRKAVFEKNIKNMATYEKGLRSVAGEAIRTIDAMERAETSITGQNYTNNNPNSETSPWGKAQPAESTSYKNMTAEQLVQRRKQMRDFVNAIQTDTDIQSVLNEDEALKKAIEKGMSSDMRTVIEWYNTERLKIQDELHARHLTNTGDWMDPKKQAARKKRLQEEWRYYLDELDAYYTERKAKIQEAQNEEGISEAEAWQRTIANEAEWRLRRSELQQLYADKSKEVVKDEQDFIFRIISERTGESSDLVQKTIGKTVDFMKKIGEKSPTELRKALGSLDKGIEQDLLKRQNAIAKQVKAIADIVNKERPFNGITENLQENLVKMGILTADMTEERNRLMAAGEDMAAFNARQFEQESKRISFLLGETENAYQMTIDQLIEHMQEKGFKEWADAVAADENMKDGLLAMLHTAYDAVQDAIKKEASLIKKQVEIQWNFAPDGDKSFKQSYEAAVSALGLKEDQVSRANSLIGAGQASERVADKLAIKQMQVQLAMQNHYFNLVRKTGQQRIDDLEAAAKKARELGDLDRADRLELDARHAAQSLGLSLSEEQKKLDEQRVAIANRLEESQNRLYTELKSWADLIADSLKTLFEASNTGQGEYYNQLAKMRLTGEGSAGGTYVVIENSGTEDAEAHYEYLDGEAALLRQLEIDRQNAIADAWKKVMDDVSQKMNDMLTDQMNAVLQNASIDTNTNALNINTDALNSLSQAVAKGLNVNVTNTEGGGFTEFDEKNPDTWPRAMRKRAGLEVDSNPHDHTRQTDPAETAQAEIDASSAVTDAFIQNKQEQVLAGKEADEKIAKSSQSAFAKMTQAANLYGIAYQAMSNDNLSATQKFEMIAIQAAGQAAITSLTTSGIKMVGDTAVQTPSVLAKIMAELGPIKGAVAFAAFTALLGGLMGLAMSKLTKSKSQIASVTGASGAGAGRLATGMLTYGEGNVNEFTDPSSLTPGRQYNVDAADGRTYRARYMGSNPRTHLTNGPEFHLVGEKGREAIIDAQTTRQITMDDNGIWRAIQTLYNGGSVSRRKTLRRGGGVQAFADGNLDDFDVAGSDTSAGMSMEQLAALQTSIDRQNDLLERALTDGIRGVFDVHGRNGLVNTYDTAKKEALRHGERYT